MMYEKEKIQEDRIKNYEGQAVENNIKVFGQPVIKGAQVCKWNLDYLRSNESNTLDREEIVFLYQSYQRRCNDLMILEIENRKQKREIESLKKKIETQFNQKKRIIKEVKVKKIKEGQGQE